MHQNAKTDSIKCRRRYSRRKEYGLKDLSALELSTAIKKGEAGVEEAVKVSLEQIKKSEDTDTCIS